MTGSAGNVVAEVANVATSASVKFQSDLMMGRNVSVGIFVQAGVVNHVLSLAENVEASVGKPVESPDEDLALTEGLAYSPQYSGLLGMSRAPA